MATSLLEAAASAAGSAIAGWVFPVQHYTLTQRFGVSNGRDRGGHPGVDMAAPIGTPVLAVADGTISFEGPASGFGSNYVSQSISGGLEADYGHMSKAYVTSGQNVRAGQIIGLVGSEGQSTGPHLHLQIKLNGKLIDPLAWLQGKGAVSAAGTSVETVAAGGSNDSGIAGAVTGGISSLLGSLLVTAVKGLLVAGGGAMVVIGVASSARRSKTGQRAESHAKSAATTAAMAA